MSSAGGGRILGSVLVGTRTEGCLFRRSVVGRPRSDLIRETSCDETRSCSRRVDSRGSGNPLFRVPCATAGAAPGGWPAHQGNDGFHSGRPLSSFPWKPAKAREPVPAVAEGVSRRYACSSRLVPSFPWCAGIREEPMRQGRFSARRNPESPVPATQSRDLASSRGSGPPAVGAGGEMTVSDILQGRPLARASWTRDRAAGPEHAAGGRVQG